MADAPLFVYKYCNAVNLVYLLVYFTSRYFFANSDLWFNNHKVVFFTCVTISCYLFYYDSTPKIRNGRERKAILSY